MYEGKVIISVSSRIETYWIFYLSKLCVSEYIYDMISGSICLPSNTAPITSGTFNTEIPSRQWTVQ